MVFEGGDLRVISPLDPTEERRYVEPTREGFSTEELENVYNMTMQVDDYVNPNAYGTLSWCSINSYASDSKAVLESSQQRLHELST